jgi:hypothetical protein
MPIVPPIFISSDDLYVFPSQEEAERSVDDYDPTDRAFDSEGRVLTISPARSWEGGKLVARPHSGIALSAAETNPSHQDQLSRLIADWLPAFSLGRIQPSSLKELVQEAVSVSKSFR